MSVEVLQNDYSVDHQRQLVAEALPELQQFIIIGRRNSNSGKMLNFASCSFADAELANAIANFIIAHPQSAMPFLVGVQSALEALARQ